jgi:DNA polymerase II small subunit
MIISRVQEALSEILTNGYQILPDAFELLEGLDDEYDIVNLVRMVIQTKRQAGYNRFEIMKQDIQDLLPRPVVKEKMNGDKTVECDLKIKSDVDVEPSDSDGVNGYRSLMGSRFMKLLKIVKQRPDSSQIQKISHLVSNGKPSKIAGLLLDRRVRRTSVEVIIDDDTGCVTVHAVDEGIKRKLSELLTDQFVVADVRINDQGKFVIKSVYPPDIPDRVSTTSKKTSYVVLTSDIHIGSKGFLEVSFLQFLKWLSGELGDVDVVKKVVCVVIGGDAIDGIGVYPRQKNELNIFDVTSQYEAFGRYIERIPKHIKIILMPGDHDPTRQALPQPRIPRRYFGDLPTMDNVVCLRNPSKFTINGVRFLSYHGRSIEDVVAVTPGLSITRPAQAMKILLKARHLAPLYGGKTPLAPDREDNLVIEEVPDVFHAGHVHIIDLEEYRGTVILNSGAWQTQTKYQQNMGIIPTPGVVPIVNLVTLEVMTKSFISSNDLD